MKTWSELSAFERAQKFQSETEMVQKLDRKRGCVINTAPGHKVCKGDLYKQLNGQTNRIAHTACIERALLVAEPANRLAAPARTKKAPAREVEKLEVLAAPSPRLYTEAELEIAKHIAWKEGYGEGQQSLMAMAGLAIVKKEMAKI